MFAERTEELKKKQGVRRKEDMGNEQEIWKEGNHRTQEKGGWTCKGRPGKGTREKKRIQEQKNEEV